MGKKRVFLTVFCCIFLLISAEAMAKKPPKPPGGDAPSAPAGLALSLAHPEVLLSWNANPESDISGYIVYRSLFSKRKYTGVNSGLVSGTSYADVPPAVDTQYYYRVTAVNSSGLESRNSDTVSVYYFDNAPPVLHGVDSVDITGSSARITWITDEPATSQVEYGTDTTYGQQTPADQALVTDHSVDLGGLDDNTLYHYRVLSGDAARNNTVSPDHTFSTPDETPPVISGVGSYDITQGSARIVWQTDEPASSRVDYAICQTPSGSYSVTDPANITDHSMDLVNLEEGTEYCYQAISTDIGGNTAVSGEYSFQTLFDVTFCLSCHDGTDPAAPIVEEFFQEGHGKAGVNLQCSDCHVNHLAAPFSYKHLKTIDAYWYPSPYGSWQLAMQAQRDYCSYACHADPGFLDGSHPIADDLVVRWPEKPYVNFQDPTASFLPGDDIPLLDADQDYSQSLSDIVMCISCHDPHGVAGIPIMLRASDGVDLLPLCTRCHFYE
jgi:predicted CXXCH cytochrome family protein